MLAFFVYDIYYKNVGVYKFFPTKDASLYSYHPSRSAGIDEMLEVYNENNITVSPQVARYVVQFDQTDINNFISTNSATSSLAFSLRNYIAYADGFNLDTKLYIYPVSGSWENGTGKFADSPETTNGVSWLFRDYADGTSWNFASNPYTTQSYDPTYTSEGGGVWFTGSADGKQLEVTQSFSLRSSKDINVSVTDIGLAWYSSSNSIGSDTDIQNNGFLIKLDNSVEFNTSQSISPQSKFFSVDTNTIYPPALELKWKDFLNTSSGSTKQTITSVTEEFSLSLREQPTEIMPDSVVKFKIDVREKYPTRAYNTILDDTLNKYFLPLTSYYAIQDVDTNEYIIDFDTTYTQISRDQNHSYFNLYMNGFEPERYYKVLVKSVFNNQTYIYDDKLYFKVVNNI
jgi:hypothetical protein